MQALDVVPMPLSASGICHFNHATCHNAVRAFVQSRLDHCNSLLSGLGQKERSRLVLVLPAHTHTTPLIHYLYWLPVQNLITFKNILLAFKSLNSRLYIADCLGTPSPTSHYPFIICHIIHQPNN